MELLDDDSVKSKGDTKPGVNANGRIRE